MWSPLQGSAGPPGRGSGPSRLRLSARGTGAWFAAPRVALAAWRHREGQSAEPLGSGQPGRTMPNGIKPVDPLDSLSAVRTTYRSGGQPGTCKYWILDLGTHLPAAPAAPPTPGCVLPGSCRSGGGGLENRKGLCLTAGMRYLRTAL